MTRRPESPEVDALRVHAAACRDGPVSPEGGQATKRAAARANGSSTDISRRMKLIEAVYRSVPMVSLLPDGRSRRGSR